MNAEESPAGDFENPPVIFIDNEEAPYSTLCRTSRQFRPCRNTRTLPLNRLRRDTKPMKGKFFEILTSEKPHEGEGCCARNADPTHAT